MFVNEPVLLLLVLLPLMAMFMLWRARARVPLIRRIGDEELIRYLSAQVSRARRFWKAVLWLAAVGALIVALARPTWGVSTQIIETQGVAVMVVLDVSASMDAQDMAPSRLERAKLDIQDLFQQIDGNEIGLVLFAGDSVLQFPLTNDVNSALTFLRAANTSAISRQGTATEEALRLAIGSFDERLPAQSVIVLVSDGENHEGDPMLTADIAAQNGIIIHTLGYGTSEGVPVPYLDFAGNVAYKTDRAGQVILSHLDEQTLQDIAGATGGIYRRAGEASADIFDLASRINDMHGGLLRNVSGNRAVERFGIFVALALLALSLEMLLPETRRKVV